MRSCQERYRERGRDVMYGSKKDKVRSNKGKVKTRYVVESPTGKVIVSTFNVATPLAYCGIYRHDGEWKITGISVDVKKYWKDYTAAIRLELPTDITVTDIIYTAPRSNKIRWHRVNFKLGDHNCFAWVCLSRANNNKTTDEIILGNIIRDTTVMDGVLPTQIALSDVPGCLIKDRIIRHIQHTRKKIL
jgi:hypothetical protein